MRTLCLPGDLAALLPDLSGRLLINSVFHVGAERLQQMLFSDSPFLQGFLQQCKFTGQRAKVARRGSLISPPQGRTACRLLPAEKPRRVFPASSCLSFFCTLVRLVVLALASEVSELLLGKGLQQ